MTESALTVGPLLWDDEVRATRCAYLVLEGACVQLVMQSTCRRMGLWRRDQVG